VEFKLKPTRRQTLSDATVDHSLPTVAVNRYTGIVISGL